MNMEIFGRIICGLIGVAGIVIFIFLSQVIQWILEDIKELDFGGLIADSVCFIIITFVSLGCLLIGYTALFAY